MGLSPIPPYYYNGVVWEESACGEQRLCEHVLFGKMTTGVAYETDRFHIPSIRVCPPQERACAL